jgi:hypothetical protein
MIETLTMRRDPASEAQRLAALDRYDILDTPPEATWTASSTSWPACSTSRAP